MAFGDVLTCIPHSDEGEKYCDTNQVCRYFDVRRGVEGFSDAYGQAFEEKPSKSLELERFCIIFLDTKIYGLLLAEYER